MWNVLQDATGALQLLSVDVAIPDGWEVVAVTVNPAYLDAPVTRVISKLAFRRRFTLAERVAIDSSSDPVVKTMLTDMSLADVIDLDDADIVAGLAYLESISLLVAGRAAEIRA